MTFDIEFLTSPLIITLLSVSVLCCIILTTAYRRRISRIRRYARATESAEIPAQLPGLSVIVYTKEDADALERLLPELFSQEYPGKFEVIVLSDGRCSDVEDVVTRLSFQHRNLRMTYVPDDSHALSRKKLAVTLGVKGASYENILLTDVNVAPNSNRWLALMARHFAAGKHVVIGACRMVDSEGANERPFAAFNTLADTTTWLTSAIGKRTYRATDKNLAFSRSLFFEKKGFADSTHLLHGIDDIFVSKIASPENCAVEIQPDAIPTFRCYDLRSQHLADKIQHNFTGKITSQSARRFFGFGSLTMWIWVAVTVGLIAIALAPFDFKSIDLSHFIPAVGSIVLGIVWIAAVAVSWRNAARALGMKISAWRLPIQIFRRPFSNFAYRLRSITNRSRNFSWTSGH